MTVLAAFPSVGTGLQMAAAPGTMLEVAMAVALVAGGVGAVFAGVAAMRIGDAWRIWAGRCDPKNKNFRPPSVRKKR